MLSSFNRQIISLLHFFSSLIVSFFFSLLEITFVRRGSSDDPQMAPGPFSGLAESSERQSCPGGQIHYISRTNLSCVCCNTRKRSDSSMKRWDGIVTEGPKEIKYIFLHVAFACIWVRVTNLSIVFHGPLLKFFLSSLERLSAIALKYSDSRILNSSFAFSLFSFSGFTKNLKPGMSSRSVVLVTIHTYTHLKDQNVFVLWMQIVLHFVKKGWNKDMNV